MKIIFLDIDGVLNSNLYSSIKRMKKVSSLDCLGRPLSNIDKHNLDILRLIVYKTGAKLVISSTWRKDIHVVGRDCPENEKTEKFIQLFKDLGWDDAPIIGVTPCLSGFRGEEVATFLDELAKTETIEDYIILDDDSDFIYGELSDLEIRQQDIMRVLDKEAQEQKSKYWRNQRHILTNRLIGLSYDDLIEILKLWSPNDSIVNNYNDYIPYMHRYGKRFK